jgi:putative transposase
MRTARRKRPGTACYHVVSRIIERRRVLNKEEKERLLKFLRAAEAFCGVEILTFTVLDNHFHVLVRVPPKQEISDMTLVERLGKLYKPNAAKAIERKLLDLRANHQQAAAEAFKTRYTRRMYDLSEFVKSFKQRFTQSYNRRHNRRGTLWEDRFKSVVVEDTVQAMGAVAAYIDLNAVRAGVVQDPADYPYSGYGEATAGSEFARSGLVTLLQALGIRGECAQAAEEYRQRLLATGGLYHLPSRTHSGGTD